MRPNIRQFLILTFIILTSVLLFLKDLNLVSATYDEDFSYIRNSIYLVNNLKWDQPYINLHPPLMYYLHGWPFLLINITDPMQTLFISRIAILPLFIIFPLFIFVLINKFYGELAGYFSVVLYSFNPEILAHARLVTADFTQAVFIFVALISFFYFLKAPNHKRLLLSGITLGLALSSKYSSLLLIPLYLIIFLFSLTNITNRLGTVLKILAIILIAFAIVHVSYFLKESGRIPSTFKDHLVNRLYLNHLTRPLLYLLPNQYLSGIDLQLATSQGIWWGYFAGKQYLYGLWYFYPAAFLLKTPIPFLLILFLSIITLIKSKKSKELDKLTLISVAFFFLYFSFFNKLIIGLRYLLMIYPLLFLFSARLIDFRSYQFKLSKPYYIFLVVLLTLYIFQTIRIAPHYLAFANEFIGGPQHSYKYFADSNLDWNQNTLLFDRYLKAHPEISIINPRKPIAGRIAVNVNEMNLYYYQQYNWLRALKKEPIDNIGYTWLIFDIKPEEINFLNFNE